MREDTSPKRFSTLSLPELCRCGDLHVSIMYVVCVYNCFAGQVYLGSSMDCRPLLPRSTPCAAIFVDDFHGDMKKLAAHLTYLASNQTAYDALRGWRDEFVSSTSGSSRNSSSGNKDGEVESGCGSKTLSPLFAKSWPCRICEWAFTKAEGTKS